MKNLATAIATSGHLIEQNKQGLSVEDVFSTYVYKGTGYSQQIVNDVNLAGNPVAAVDQKIIDSFATTLYTGNASDNPITTGIDSTTDEALIWIKNRSSASTNHYLLDTVNGNTKALKSNLTDAEQNLSSYFDFTSTGFDLSGNVDFNNGSNVAWTFKQATDFFDVVKYTGNGIAGKTVSHSLGSAPGMMIVKKVTSTGQCNVQHKSLTSAAYKLELDAINGEQSDSTMWNSTAFTSSEFTLGTNGGCNENGHDYVAYLFADDSSADGMVRCGTMTTDGGGSATVNLGWKPQYVMIKKTSSTGNWIVIDNQRGMGEDGTIASQVLYPDVSNAEGGPNAWVSWTSTGFTVTGQSASSDYIYLAIRAPEFDGSSGGMTWIKRRNTAYANMLFDTERGINEYLYSNDTYASTALNESLTNFNNNGVTIGSDIGLSESGSDYVSWTFRKAPRFFDVVKYTGDGVAGREVAHDLGVAPGMIIVKGTTFSDRWAVYHKDVGTGSFLELNSTGAKITAANYFDITPTDSVFTLGGATSVNSNGNEHIAYLFADDPLGPSGDGSDGLIACGSYTGNGNANGPKIDLGWEPQWLLVKCTSFSGDWSIIDNMRGAPHGSNGEILQPNTTAGETNRSVKFHPWGFQPADTYNDFNDNGETFSYMAIRRPMRTPESSDEVFAVEYGNSSGSSTVHEYDAGFPVDMALRDFITTSNQNNYVHARLTQGKYLLANTTAIEANWSGGAFDSNTSWLKDLNSSENISHMWKRATGFFDVVCYTGDGIAGRTVDHNLGVVPEMMWVKNRESVEHWVIYHPAIGADYYMWLNDIDASSGPYSGTWNNTTPTDALFTVGSSSNTNQSAKDHIAYLFATLAGISKVGSYTGNGGNQMINCDFSSGARFVMIKRTDSTGDWFFWDTARGIVTGNDPHLSLNTTAAEVTTDDSIDPAPMGFIVNQNVATNINVNAGEYIYYAIA